MLLRGKHRKVRILLLIVLLVGASCENNTVYHSYQHVTDKGWSKSDTLYFAFPVTDSTVAYRFTVEMRNKGNYPYEELYLFIHRPNTVDSTLCIIDTIRCELADSEGNWEGTGLGALYQSAHFYEEFNLSRSGEFRVGIMHGMKDSLLQGISDIGLRVEKIEKN